MIAFSVENHFLAKKILENVQLITYAESLGGVESLITYPMIQTHGDVPAEIRAKLGITDNFLRLSVGIENIDDLLADLRLLIEKFRNDTIAFFSYFNNVFFRYRTIRPSQMTTYISPFSY